MSNYIQSNQVVTLPNQAAITVNAADSGKTLLVPAQGAASVITMPSLQAGLRYRFLATAALGSNAVITPPTNGTITGTVLNLTPGVAGVCVIASVIKAANNTITLAALAPAGTYLDMNCDGSIWYISGISTAVGFA